MNTKRIGAYPRGEAHLRHKLSEADVLDMRKSYKEGATQACLAQKYGVSQGVVSKIISGRTWNHLPL